MKTFIQFCLVAALAAAIYAEDIKEKKWATKELSSTKARDDLFTELFAHYNKDNYPENTTVSFGVSLLNADFCEEKNLMHSNVWLRVAWQDDRLKWDAEAKGVNLLRIPNHRLWMPDITLYNGVHPVMDCSPTNAIVYSSGSVLWVPPCKLESYCNLTIGHSPNKEQICKLKFGSWTFDGITMGFDFWKNEKHTDISHFSGYDYQVTTNTAIKEEKHYDCCLEPYVSILYSIGFTHRSETDKICHKE